MVNRITKLLIILITIMLILGACSYDNNESKKIEESTTSKNEVNDNSLPIIVINTNGVKMIVGQSEKITGTIEIFNSDNGFNYINEEAEFKSHIGISIRGNSSKYYPKKQYSIELRDEEGNEDNKKILGMSKDSDWVLNAPFEDKSLMRNYMAYAISDEIMEYAPKARFCEVYLIDDGSENPEQRHFKGLYVMNEKIKRGNDRVDIIETQGNKGETSFIVVKDRYKDGDTSFRNYGKEVFLYGNSIVNRYPRRDITDEQIDYINKTISKFERVLYSDKYDVVKEGYNEYIDVNTFVDYYIINEFFNNTDAGIYSTFIHKDYGEKIKAGPVWDFNQSMGNSDLLSDYYEYAGFYMHQAPWFERLLNDKNFVKKVVSRYRILRQAYLSDEYLLSFIDDTVELLGDAPDRNFSVWPIYMCNQAKTFRTYYEGILEPYDEDIKLLDEYLKAHPRFLQPTDGLAKSFEEEIQMLKQFIKNRGAWMDENIKSLYKWTD